MDPIVGDASRAIDELELHRLHYTYSLVDLRTFREDYRYVYRNADTRPHRVVPLLWRWREIQANMVVLDAADENLIYLPTGITRQAEEAYLESLIRKGIQKIPRGQSPNPTRLTAFRQSIQLALQFESAQEVRVEAYNLAHQLATDFPEIQEFTRVTTFLALLSEFYMPLALLGSPLPPAEFAFVRHGADIYLPPRQEHKPRWAHLRVRPIGLKTLFRFFVTGGFVFRTPIAVDAVRLSNARSFHCRVTVPAGLRIRRRFWFWPRFVLSEESVSWRTSYDDGNVYVYFSGEDLDIVKQRTSEANASLIQTFENALTRLVAIRTKLGLTGPSLDTPASWEAFKARFREGAKVRLELRTPVGVARGVGSLILLLWSVVGATLLCGAMNLLGVDRFLDLLGLLLVVVLTIGIFAVDKRILREFVSAHALSAVAPSVAIYALSHFR